MIAGIATLEFPATVRMMILRRSGPQNKLLNVSSSLYWVMRFWALSVSYPQMHSAIIWLFWFARCCESSPIMNRSHCALSAAISTQPCSLVMLIVVGAPLWVMLNSPICCVLLSLFHPSLVAFSSSLLRNCPSVSGLRSKRLSLSRTGFCLHYIRPSLTFYESPAGRTVHPMQVSWHSLWQGSLCWGLFSAVYMYTHTTWCLLYGLLKSMSIGVCNREFWWSNSSPVGRVHT